MSALEPRHLNVLRRMRDLGGWQYAEAISAHEDGRTAGAVLSALLRRGLVARIKADPRPPRSCTVWTLTEEGMEAAR